MPPLHCEFAKWIMTTPTLILPTMSNTFLPLIRFKNATTVVTLGWEAQTAYYNLDSTMFPNANTIVALDGQLSSKTLPRFPMWITNQEPPECSYEYIHYDPSIKDKYWRPSEKKVQYQPNQWVNEDWLKTQYEELFRVAQNELDKRPELK